MIDDYFNMKPSEETVKMAETKKYSGKSFFLETKIEGDLLTISIWKQQNLQVAGMSARPDGVYLLDRKTEKWRGYWHKTGEYKRSGAMFSNFFRIEFAGDWRWWKEFLVYSREDDENKVIDFLGSSEKTLENAIDRWQEGKSLQSRMDSYDRMFQRIDAVMDTFQDLPDDWQEWIENAAFANARYIFFKSVNRKNQMYRCEVCGHMAEVNEKEMKFRHNVPAVCPACGTRVIAKGWNRQKYIDDVRDVAVYQKTTDDRLAVRKFYIRKQMRNDGVIWKARYLIDENRREILSNKGRCVEAYERGTHIPTNIYRWLGDKSNYDWRQTRVVYDRNINELLGNLPQIGHVDLPALFAAGQGIEVRHEAILNNLEGFAQIEYLQKAGLGRMARECAERGRNYFLLNKKGKNLEDFLQVDRKGIDQLKRMNGGLIALCLIQKIRASGDIVDDESIEWMAAVGADPDSMYRKVTGASLQRMVNYIRKQLKATKMKYNEWSMMYNDYLHMAKKRGMDPRDEIVWRNPRMRYFHDLYVEEEARKNLEKTIRDKKRKYKNIAKDAKKNGKHFNFEKDGYVITVASGPGDILNEGRAQHHCVGAGETYYSRMDKGESFICFLRKQEEPEQPYYTLEVKWDGQVLQAYGAYDRKPDWDIVERLLRSFKKEIWNRCAEEESKAKAAERTVMGQEAFNRLITAAG